ncbi:hypothetical protein ACMA1I_16095 [Pontibacter sp. 13R65]|uniref:hypothetical protein n=1 Tax=Pontibacter sp. 13R65 TaxID=3127458 RepID=UPI00301E1C88
MIRSEIQDTLNILTNFKKDQVPQEEVLLMLKYWVRKTAGCKNLTEETVQQLLADNLDALRKVWQEAFLTLDFEKIEEAESAVPAHLKEYRYSVAGIVEIYAKLLNKSIHRKTVTDHMTLDKHGISKLKKITIEGDKNSVLESDLLQYFYHEAHVRLKPEDIRRFSYKAPAKREI